MPCAPRAPSGPMLGGGDGPRSSTPRTTETPCSAASSDDLRGRGATLIVVEDAHWADDATIELLAMLGRRAGELPLLLVVTYRDDDVAARPPAPAGARRPRDSQPDGGAEPGDRSRSSAVDALAAPHGLAGEELHRRTGGNPFFVTEALAAPDDDLPSSIRLAVLARAARLDAGARAVLDAVAVVPGRAEHWLVEAMSQPAAGDVDACVCAGCSSTRTVPTPSATSWAASRWRPSCR